jgi:hypothetical protein
MTECDDKLILVEDQPFAPRGLADEISDKICDSIDYESGCLWRDPNELAAEIIEMVRKHDGR